MDHSLSDNVIADHILIHCGSLKPDEALVIIGDETTREIVDLIAQRADKITHSIVLHQIETANMHGQEPPLDVSDAMADADLIIGMTAMSLAHTRARHQANLNGARYLSMPDYSWDLFRDPSILTDYQAEEPIVQKVADLLGLGTMVHVTTAAGTDIRMNIAGRLGNSCPGFVSRPGTLGSPPDIEANVAPLEDGANGVVVVDGSIPCHELGLLETPITLQVRDGRIVHIDGDRETVATLERLFSAAGTDDTRILAECGIGMNRNAKLQGNMLTDEGAFGCVHFGFGANATIGGKNHVPFHLDFVFRDASLRVDDIVILENGALVL